MVPGSSPQARGTRLFPAAAKRRERFIPAGAGNATSGTVHTNNVPVHPRRRGERVRRADQSDTHPGSSPQARGTRRDNPSAPDEIRFIPAGAGNAHHAGRRSVGWPVHPRRRGERLDLRGGKLRRVGSSPQARGTPVNRAAHGRADRFIPAGAGNAFSTRSDKPARAVHPRRRGERTSNSRPSSEVDGSSPQARGTHGAAGCHKRPVRFIPAGAGNAILGLRGRPLAPVHPRRRGERPRARHGERSPPGSSPQARGTRYWLLNGGFLDRFIPAGAGNAFAPMCISPKAPVHPRRRGERATTGPWQRLATGSSPQARGTRAHARPGATSRRFIPAGAGNATPAKCGARSRPVHPRRRGERSRLSAPEAGARGSSPQARGTRSLPAPSGCAFRFIPAGAGNALHPASSA